MVIMASGIARERVCNDNKEDCDYGVVQDGVYTIAKKLLETYTLGL